MAVTIETAVMERPILFSPVMARAILDGRKTMTRRVVNASHLARLERETIKYGVCDYEAGPYGKPGDRLWVRETYTYITVAQNERRDKVRPDGTPVVMLYRADEVDEDSSYDMGFKWQPSIFMPRWASRLLLEVTHVRVEPLQHITHEDADAEGFGPDNAPAYRFSQLWDVLNGKRGYSWESNPSVWVVGFKVVQG